VVERLADGSAEVIAEAVGLEVTEEVEVTVVEIRVEAGKAEEDRAGKEDQAGVEVDNEAMSKGSWAGLGAAGPDLGARALAEEVARAQATRALVEGVAGVHVRAMCTWPLRGRSQRTRLHQAARLRAP
jgi:hypothetical protein